MTSTTTGRRARPAPSARRGGPPSPSRCRRRRTATVVQSAWTTTVRHMGSVLEDRRDQSDHGLRDLRSALSDSLPTFDEMSNVVVYITGSFGRLEARYPGSDLDIFFMYMPEVDAAQPESVARTAELSRLHWFELIAAVINVGRRLEFAPFSKDGEFLKVHNVFHIGNELGSRTEDADNGFTARLLLLLEGRYLVNQALYDEVLLEVIKFYFRDYAANRDHFRPQSLINDILRYWRTLCLQYEHQRRSDFEKAGDTEDEITSFKAESALANLKLRYSRLALCFSMIAMLIAEPDGIPPERVRELCRIVPSERWGRAAERDPSGKAQELVPKILDSYEQFLTLVAEETSVLLRLREPEERAGLRAQAACFGDLVFDLLRLVPASDKQFRRLVV
jgi:hypothetical protein